MSAETICNVPMHRSYGLPNCRICAANERARTAFGGQERATPDTGRVEFPSTGPLTVAFAAPPSEDTGAPTPRKLYVATDGSVWTVEPPAAARAALQGDGEAPTPRWKPNDPHGANIEWHLTRNGSVVFTGEWSPGIAKHGSGELGLFVATPERVRLWASLSPKRLREREKIIRPGIRSMAEADQFVADARLGAALREALAGAKQLEIDMRGEPMVWVSPASRPTQPLAALAALLRSSPARDATGGGV